MNLLFGTIQTKPKKITQELNGVKAGVDKYKNILHKFEEMQILWEMGMEDKDETVCDDVEVEIKEINEAIEQLELELLLSENMMLIMLF